MSQNFITPDTATEYINRYLGNLDKMTTPEFQGSLIHSELFDVSAIQALLNQKDCVSFRACFGMNEDNIVCCIFYGVDANGNNIVDATHPLIVENGSSCPPDC